MADEERRTQIIADLMAIYSADKRTCDIRNKLHRECIFFIPNNSLLVSRVTPIMSNSSRQRGQFKAQRYGTCELTCKKVQVGNKCGVSDDKFKRGINNLCDDKPINHGI